MRARARLAGSRSCRHAIRDPAELCRRLSLEDRWARQAEEAATQFSVFVPHPYLERISPGMPDDPLLRQFLPLHEETIPQPGFTSDPVGDGLAEQTRGLLRKYKSRVLLITTGACAVHCRYCFRREFPYQGGPGSAAAWRPALNLIAADTGLDEVILSGGDPLMLTDPLLAALVEQIAKIPHIRRLRIHTRLPIMIPQRVNAELMQWLTGTRLAPVVVIHANHAREIDAAVADSLERLADAGVMLLNQSVLLAGVNDSGEALIDLSHRLLDCRVIPYYLHQLDRVAGAAHFEVSEATGRQLIQQIRAELPGYAVPRYVKEVAGEMSKRVIA